MPLDARYEGDVRSGSPGGGRSVVRDTACGGRAVVVGSRDGGRRIQLLFRRYLSSEYLVFYISHILYRHTANYHCQPGTTCFFSDDDFLFYHADPAH